MSSWAHLRRSLAPAVLAITFAHALVGKDTRTRVFATDFDHVWAAASEVAGAGFHPDRISKEQGKLSLRTTPFYGHRLNVVIVDLGRGKTRISVESRGNLSQKTTGADGRRHCDRYLELVSRKVRAQVGRE